MKFCECGCGNVLPEYSTGKFLNNHWWNLDEYKEKIRASNRRREKDMPDISCVGRRFKGGKYYSRWLMEQHLGRKLDRLEFVHHINGDKTDDRIENLEVMSKKDHCVHHHTVKKTLEFTCYRCGKKFLRKEWYNRRSKRKYCNRTCFKNTNLSPIGARQV